MKCYRPFEAATVEVSKPRRRAPKTQVIHAADVDGDSVPPMRAHRIAFRPARLAA